MWGMGDAVILLPLLNQLKIYSNNAKIVVLATDETAKVFEGYADEIIIFDSRLSIFLPFRILKTILELQKKGIGIVFDFEQFTRISSILGFLSGGAERIGYHGTGKELLYTKRVKFDPDKHAIEAFDDVLRSYTPTITIPKELLPLKISKEDEKNCRGIYYKKQIRKKYNRNPPGLWKYSNFQKMGKRKVCKIGR